MVDASQPHKHDRMVYVMIRQVVGIRICGHQLLPLIEIDPNRE